MNKDVYYGCQIKVPRFGNEGQSILAKSRCAIIGMGGLGCPVAQYLVPSGIGYIGLYDNDCIEESNINRQILYSYGEIGQKKIAVAKQKLQNLNPFVCIEAFDMRIDAMNWKEECGTYDIIIDCTDNFYSKFLIHDVCMILKKKLVQAGIYQTSGQVLYFNFEHEKIQSCYRCLWNDAPSIDKQANCEAAGVLSLVAGSVGIMQANMVVLSLLGKSKSFESSMMIYDGELLEWTKIYITQKDRCMCNTKKEKEETQKYLYDTMPMEVDMLSYDESVTVLDVRNEDAHAKNSDFKGPVVRMSDSERMGLKNFVKTMDASREYILVCYAGVRSLQMAKKMRSLGIKKVQSLTGGYNNLASKK